ncbi:MAG: TauD/TfdA family dioxygenase [Gammaproteobacteria bacterium]|jgi:alpha-ketoglutarate-dependent taurine dioxygenase
MAKIEPYESSLAWKPETIRKDTSWVTHLSDENTKELKEALAFFKAWVKSNGKQDEVDSGVLYPCQENFPLPVFGNKLAQTRHNLEHAYGIALFKGFPQDVSEQDAKIMFGGLVAYVGTLMPQTVNRELLQPVQDEGQAKLDERRGSKHNMGLPIHNDGCDVVGFLCRRTPLRGGATILVSAAAVHNRMLEEHPELVTELYQPFYHSWQDYQYPGGINDEQASQAYNLSRTWCAPIFSREQGKLCVRYSRFYTDRAQTYDNIPRLTERQIEALDTFDRYINDQDSWQFRRDFGKGDILFVNNHELFHSRTEFVNGENIEECRQLYRAWIAVPNSRPLSSSMACFFGNTAAGSLRGGVKEEFIAIAQAQAQKRAC